MAAQSIGKKPDGRLAIDAVDTRAPKTATIESPAFSNGAEIPDTYSYYGEGCSPELRWSGVPSGTRSFALVVEDADAPQETPFTHWLLYNLPPNVRHLPASIPDKSIVSQLGALQGRSSAGSIGYFGPHPPERDPAHRYHFELFCLDAPLDVGPGADRNQLLSAMAGHVLAKGDLTGLYEAPPR